MIDLPTEADPVKVICGDADDVFRELPDGCFDAVVTDPPYGLREARGKNKSRGQLATPKDYGVSDWDDKPCSPEQLAHMRRVSQWQVIFGGNFFELPPSSCWLVWDKLNSGDFADCELAWTNLKKAIRCIRHRWNGMIREGNEKRYHPTQKPLAVMRWCIRQLPDDVKLILDPFGGSGTTAIAALHEGRHCLVIEQDPAYCEVIRNRVADAQGVGKGSFLAPSAGLFD